MTTARGQIFHAPPPSSVAERVEEVARLDGFIVKEIISGVMLEPTAYLQDHDEWVVVVHGSAVLDVDGDVLQMRVGDWAALGAGVPHRVVSVEPGTRWLAVHGSSEASEVPAGPEGP